MISFSKTLAVEWNNPCLARLILKSNSGDELPLETLHSSFQKSLLDCKTEVANVLLEYGKIHTRSSTLQRLIYWAYVRRVLLGQNSKYDESLGIAIKGLTDEDLDLRGEYILKSCCEIGSLSGLQSSLLILGNFSIHLKL